MGTLSRAAALIAASMITACPALSPAAATDATGTAGPAAAAADPIGGARLDSRGVVVDKAPGVPRLPKIAASSYVIADAETGQVLAAKNPHGRYRPASTLKVLTALTLIPRLDPDKKVKPSKKAANVEGTAVGIKSTWRYSVRDLLYGLMLSSGNDAAVALAEANGGLSRTLAQMNAEARRLQALDTVAKTPNGLDKPGQRSSAYDLALLARAGLAQKEFRRYVAARTYDFPAPPTKKQRKRGRKTGGYQIQNHNRLYTTHRYAGAVGVKNGWTSKAQGTFIGAATRGGHTIIISLMHSGPPFWEDARKLLTWGLTARPTARPVGELVDPAPAMADRPLTTPSTPTSTGPLTRRQSAGWRLPVVLTGAGVAVAGGLGFALLRRRRRVTIEPGFGALRADPAPPGPPRPGAPGGPDAPGGPGGHVRIVDPD